ncbi:uncharacterized protein G2W53_014282 [Senna tora]|uniref:Uncharacterized protein n=1 Tax=Senna tora TaxID=362788 RepID=A0A834WTC9_9FABA|nr:uncharacterized protein G2W53_014282 [Senna tora]
MPQPPSLSPASPLYVAFTSVATVRRLRQRCHRTSPRLVLPSDSTVALDVAVSRFI